MTASLTLLPAEHGQIRQLVDRAADALARAVRAADVLDACAEASAAFNAGKVAARLAKAKGAHDDVLAAIHTAQVDALEIDCLAKSRLADEYDAARDRGEVSTQGQRTDLIPGENKVPTVADIGMTAKMVFEARQIRDAYIREPNIVRRVLDGMLQSGKEPTKADLRRGLAPKANLRAAIGTATASKEDRGDNFYQTPDAATRTLLALERFTSLVWEPACGLSAIGRILEAVGYDVRLSDLVDRGAVDRHGVRQDVGDFLSSVAGAEEDGPDIVTNPPYGEVLNDFVAHALRVHRPRKMALLLNSNFMFGFKDDSRSFVMDENPPARIYAFKRRLPMMHREGWEGPKASSRMNTAWFVWERQADGSYGKQTVLRRVDWMDHVEAESLTPGVAGAYGLASFVDADEDFTRATPRKTIDERADEARTRALAWISGRRDITRRDLRREIGVRDSVAGVLIDECVTRGMLGLSDDAGVHRVLQTESEAA